LTVGGIAAARKTEEEISPIPMRDAERTAIRVRLFRIEFNLTTPYY
jgi:hypothetical protein